jgi:hypothetical protein
MTLMLIDDRTNAASRRQRRSHKPNTFNTDVTCFCGIKNNNLCRLNVLIINISIMMFICSHKKVAFLENKMFGFGRATFEH